VFSETLKPAQSISQSVWKKNFWQYQRQVASANTFV